MTDIEVMEEVESSEDEYSYSYPSDEDEKPTTNGIIKLLASEFSAICTKASAKVDFYNSHMYILQMLVSVERFELDHRHYDAYGMDYNKLLAIKFSLEVTCGRISLKELICVEQRNKDGSSCDNFGCTSFQLGWVLKRRVAEYWHKYLSTLDTAPEVQLDNAQELMNIFGCTHSDAISTLSTCFGDLNDAMLHLLERRPAMVEGGVDHRHAPSTKPVYETSPIIDPPSLLRQQVMPVGVGEGPSMQDDSLIAQLLRHATQYPAEVSMRKNNFLVAFLHILLGEIHTCGSRCLVCNESVAFPSALPSVCGRSLCVVGYEELGVGVDLEGIIFNHPEVVDLLVSLFYTAVQEGRLHGACPSVFLPLSGATNSWTHTDTQTHTLKRVRRDTGGDMAATAPLIEDSSDQIEPQNLDEARWHSILKPLLDLLPSLRQLQQWVREGALSSRLNALHLGLYPLLRWIVTSNRSHLRLLAPAEAKLLPAVRMGGGIRVHVGEVYVSECCP